MKPARKRDSSLPNWIKTLEEIVTDTRLMQSAETWNERYREPSFVFGTQPNAYLADKRGLIEPGKTALAVADGEGRNSVWLAQQGLHVDAFDISPVGVTKARQLARQAAVTVNSHVRSCDDWDWRPAAYDYVVAIFVQFADPKMRQRLFANMIATLKPGGFLILQGYTPKQLEYKTGGPGLLEHLYSEEMLTSAFSELRLVDMQVYEAELNEGTRHSGMSALIGMVCRK
jgi:cyclopropane fatty-acyl-phospholipid synthase-like methyltransferase